MKVPTYDEVLKMPAGTWFRLKLGPQGSRRVKYHLRGVVDGRLVVRRWVKQFWSYETQGREWWEIFVTSTVVAIGRGS